jgi:hypothetical protein
MHAAAGGGISYNVEEFKAQVQAGIDASMTDQVCVCGAVPVVRLRQWPTLNDSCRRTLN